MELASFVTFYFAAKQLSLLTAFLCWKPEELLVLQREATRAGMRVRMSQRAPALAPDGAAREAVLLDLTCPGAQLQLDQASSSRAFNVRHSWLLLGGARSNASRMQATLASALVLPDADVALAAGGALLDVYRVRAERPLLVTPLGAPEDWAARPAAPTRRKDLHNVYLKASTIISQPQHFKGWADLTVRHIDTFPKLTYPLMMLLAEDLHFRYNLKQVDLYGDERNGSFDGLAGQLQRREIELGVTSMFMRKDRSRVLHFCSETVELRGAFIFRQPSKSSVSNVFLLPFSRGVWAGTAAVLAAAAALLAALARRPRLRARDPVLARLSLGETVIFAVGTVCQQGFHLVPALASARVVMFCMLLTSLFAFTAYSAKIVAILQTPSDAIRTIDDLASSPMTLGIQETTYKKVYFAESSQPATQRLYRRKLQPLGERAYLSVVDGVRRLRTGLFAFQVEEPSGYDIISKTFTEHEKCGLQQIQAFKLPMVAVPIRRHSGYKELFATRLRWQREVGLMERSRRVWLAARPRCDAGAGGFVSVGLIDIISALHVLAAGMCLSLLLLAAECSMGRCSPASRRLERHHSRMVAQNK
ncbi:ionotropic receptor 75a-like [Choristoneura fumiferana]|uniref:ionotropic receptor 75a-like n=1 Tax=Choristoneura fumiferana TaxID=7141 RepID=UPI003D1576C4